jgi:hypothetical protein
MDTNQLINFLNKTPIKVNTGLIKVYLSEHYMSMKQAEGHLLYEMLSKGFELDWKNLNDSEKNRLINRYFQEQYSIRDQINFHELKKAFPEESDISTWLWYQKEQSLLKRHQLLLTHEKNGYIQPKFAINSAGSIYTAKPSLQLPYLTLSQFFDCDFLTFDSLSKATKAISNAKKDSEIISVIRTTVFYRNIYYKKEKEKRKQRIIEEISKEPDFMPLERSYDGFTLQQLGYE